MTLELKKQYCAFLTESCATAKQEEDLRNESPQKKVGCLQILVKLLYTVVIINSNDYIVAIYFLKL